MNVDYKTKLRRARIDTQRILDGLDPIFTIKELNEEQARIHRNYDKKNKVKGFSI